MTTPNFLVSCGKCSKFNVCTIFRAIAPLLGKWDDETRPFEPDQIASLCKEFDEKVEKDPEELKKELEEMVTTL